MQPGGVESFDEKPFVQAAELLVQGDEPERALNLLNLLPAYYRDNPPLGVQKLRQDILQSLITPHAYMTAGLDAEVKEEQAEALLGGLLRGRLVLAEVQRYNELGLTPHIIDMGPGEYFVPIGLQRVGARFTYWDVVFDQNTQAAAHPIIQKVRVKEAKPGQPIIFLALELIEHLASEQDIAIEAYRYAGKAPDRVHLSTPQYCYDGRTKAWRKPCGLPHLRCYTPKEFLTAAQNLFPTHQWSVYQGQIMSLRGQRQDKIDQAPFNIEQ